MRRVICSTALAVVAAFAGVALVAPSSQADGEGGSYVAFGDSFTSGPGIAPQKAGACTRSARNFPTLLAAELGHTGDAFVDASCGGATTDDLFNPQTRGGNEINPAQLDALTEDTTLVTFGTIGGNDIGLVGLASSCFTSDCVPTQGDPLEGKFEALEVALNLGIDQTQLRAPAARIVVVGYSTYLPPGGCPSSFLGALTVEEFDYVQGQIDRLSDLLEKVAGEQGVDFVDMREIPFAIDHTACAEPTKQWIRAVATYNDGVQLHPSRCGMDAMAQHLHREIVGAGAPAFDNSCVSAGPAPTQPTSPTPPVTTPVPPAAPAESAAAAVRRELRTQAARLRLTTSCRPGRSGGRVVLRVNGRAPDAAMVRFVVGSRRVGLDRTAPLRVTRPVGTRAWRGKVVAKVKMRRGDVSVWHRIERPRPRCLR